MNMASSGHGYHSYYQPAMPYYYNYAQQPARGGGGSRPSVHLFLFLATVSLYAAASLYALCESAVESLLHQVRPLVILSPLLFIVVVQLWVASSGERRGAHLLSNLVAGDHKIRGAPYGRAGSGAASSSPWGVALVLVLVLFLVSWQSSLQEWRFLLRSR